MSSTLLRQSIRRVNNFSDRCQSIPEVGEQNVTVVLKNVDAQELSLLMQMSIRDVKPIEL